MKVDIKTILIVGVVLIIGVALVYYSGELFQSTEPTVQTEELSGTLRLGGSTTVYPIALTASGIFMQQHPGVTITVDQSSTGEGMVRFLNGEIDILDGTRPPKDSEYESAIAKGMDIQMTVVSNDAVVVVVNKENPLRDISKEDLDKIFYTGEITDWSEVTDGEKTGKINVYGTDPAISGTAELFTKVIHPKGTFVEGYTILYPTPTVVPTIASDPDGIAYTPLVWVDDSVILLDIDGMTPTDESILDTSYKLARKMLMMTDGTPTGLEREFINFILSSEGQQIVRDEGFIPIG
ncbi:MAG: PstS family phosphate ABC transporter substrate-binding protein [ANME-2 cluster archaeon]|nr:PstS family phosphate ABC transporter substrate-binding protein [ANME-2 cluster archaeon]